MPKEKVKQPYRSIAKAENRKRTAKAVAPKRVNEGSSGLIKPAPLVATTQIFPPQFQYFAKMTGSGRSPLKVLPRNAAIGFIGGLASIGTLAVLTNHTHIPWLMAPFGASCVLAFGLWDAPLSQPRNIVGGHLVTAFVGLFMVHLFGSSALVLGAAVGLGIAAMLLTKTTHPPAGANPIVVILAGSHWSFLLTPVLVGALVIVVLALLINNLDPKRRYPTFWI